MWHLALLYKTDAGDGRRVVEFLPIFVISLGCTGNDTVDKERLLRVALLSTLVEKIANCNHSEANLPIGNLQGWCAPGGS